MNKTLKEIKKESLGLDLLSDSELMEKIIKTRKRAKKETLEKIIGTWFAIVQEVSFRQLKLRHFDTQLLAGILLHEGKIVEMKTGEGKTLASSLPVSLNALTEKGVHVVTVNDYLAERDEKMMGKIYHSLGLTSSFVKSSQSISEKKKSYSANITYINNSEVVFDYLRDSCTYNLGEIVQRPFHFCVIDEIDSILIDEARTPLILSDYEGETNKNKLNIAKKLAKKLEKDFHFQLDEKRRDINLTEKGYIECQERLGKKSLYDEADPWILEILNALKAEYIFKKNKDYILLDNKVMIVDEFTGRIMEDRRWSMGIHEAIETKEKVKIGSETKTKATITYQNFFPLYPKLAGMTGTAKTAEKELKDIYNLKVVVIPTNKKMIRKDLPDLVYQTEFGKWKAVLEKSQECFQKGQPILIGTTNVEKSEFLSELFKQAKIKHEILNAKPENLIRENEIVAQAGKLNAVTIATNMAGRGTDILLGGNLSFLVKEKLIQYFSLYETELMNEIKKENEDIKSTILSFYKMVSKDYLNKKDLLIKHIKSLPFSDEIENSLSQMYDWIFEKMEQNWKKENKQVKSLGGLFILGTERHETRRIDNQLRGRSGRQGDPGISQFFVSLEDDLMKLFGADSIKNLVNSLIQDESIPLESPFLTEALENAQKKIENYNYDIRKNVFEYDEILNLQRKNFLKCRNDLVFNNNYETLFLQYSEIILKKQYISLKKNEIERKKKFTKFANFQNLWNKKDLFSNQKQFSINLEKWFGSYSNNIKSNIYLNSKFSKYRQVWINYDLRFAHTNVYEQSFIRKNRDSFLLELIDFYWTEHITRINIIRETINWRAYGQQNPLSEYNLSAFESYKTLFEQIRTSIVYYSLNSRIHI